jgi:hypothetical protein
MLQSVSVTSIPISAAITAYARIHISQLKLDIYYLLYSIRKGIINPWN